MIGGVRGAMGVCRIGRSLRVALIENNVMSFVDSGSFDAQFPQCADDHLGVLVAGEIAAGAGYAPIEVALIVEDGTAPRTATHKIYGADAWRLAVLGVVRRTSGIENGQIDLGPRVLVAPDDDAGTVYIQE